MKKINFILLIMPLSLMLISCVRLRDKDASNQKNQSTTPLETQVSHQVQNIKYQFENDNSPNSYKVRFTFDESIKGHILKVTKTSEKSSTPDMLWDLKNYNDYVDSQTLPGEHYKYEFSVPDNDQIELETIELDIPQDLVVEKFWMPPNNVKEYILNKYNRIFLYENSVITTNGVNLKIQAKELISFNSTIQAFPHNQKAPKDQDGRNGGQIEIKLEKASGDLYFYLNAENGGDGSSGREPDDSLTGEPGEPGADGQWGNPTTNYNDFLKRNISYYRCIKNPENGFRGHNGKQGYRGNSGKKGGSSASLYLEINDGVPASFKFQKSPGDKGIGGVGGRGGAAGIGGQPGKNVVEIKSSFIDVNYESCSAALMGPKGELGPMGPYGEEGSVGDLQPICIKKQDKLNCF